ALCDLAINNETSKTSTKRKKYKKLVEWRVCNMCRYSGTAKDRTWYVDRRNLAATKKEEAGHLCSTCYSRIVRALEKRSSPAAEFKQVGSPMPALESAESSGQTVVDLDTFQDCTADTNPPATTTPDRTPGESLVVVGKGIP
ncbi:hypothetical protein HDU91_002213, partial [Kappamyces sp. JEL0680]